ncbi:MAG: RsmB/NOP family class I SAM-dependent RNA methyltransferase [Thiobacillaceae bacterium]|nr:RsmB/NOP family class I SAM-dependent RNA methyltransferase [Thiobacillaceae bacterium]
MPLSVLLPEPLAPFGERLEALAAALGLDAQAREDLWASLDRPPPLALWANPLRADPVETLQALERAGFRLRRPATHLPAKGEHRLMRLAATLPAQERARLTHHPLVGQGRVYVQGLSSQWAVWALDPKPGEAVLDLAAAPGSKTALMAAAMADTGLIAAVEPVRARFFKLKANLERCGVTCARLYLADGRAVGAKTPARFERVLLDAPCSSETRIRLADPDTWRHWRLRKVYEVAHKQQALIASAWQALRPGGVLLYSTCSYAPEENEAVVAGLLERHPEAEILPIAPRPPAGVPGLTAWAGRSFPADLRQTMRILPQPPFTGFYLALLRKRAG